MVYYRSIQFLTPITGGLQPRQEQLRSSMYGDKQCSCTTQTYFKQSFQLLIDFENELLKKKSELEILRTSRFFYKVNPTLFDFSKKMSTFLRDRRFPLDMFNFLKK